MEWLNRRQSQSQPMKSGMRSGETSVTTVRTDAGLGSAERSRRATGTSCSVVSHDAPIGLPMSGRTENQAWASIISVKTASASIQSTLNRNHRGRTCGVAVPLPLRSMLGRRIAQTATRSRERTYTSIPSVAGVSAAFVRRQPHCAHNKPVAMRSMRDGERVGRLLPPRKTTRGRNG